MSRMSELHRSVASDHSGSISSTAGDELEHTEDVRLDVTPSSYTEFVTGLPHVSPLSQPVDKWASPQLATPLSAAAAGAQTPLSGILPLAVSASGASRRPSSAPIAVPTAGGSAAGVHATPDVVRLMQPVARRYDCQSVN